MPVTTLALTAELPELGGSLSWSQLEAWAVAMREELPAAALAAALEELQDRLIDRVCGRKWLPVRELPAPFGCPGCGVMSDFERKGKRTRLRKFSTAAGVVEIRLANVGCRSCRRVFAPLLLLLDLSGKRRTDRLMVELAELATQMSFARAGAVAASFGLPGSAGRAHAAVADLAPLLDGVGRPDVPGAPAGAQVVIFDGTGMRAGRRRLGVNGNIALGVTGRGGPRRRRRATTTLLGLTVGQPWSAMADQLRDLRPPAMVVVDGELAITTLAQTLWPDVPIQRCWWHLPRALRWALYADKAPAAWANTRRTELTDLLHRVARERLTHAQALAAYDAFTASVTAEGHHAAGELLAGARDQVFTCLRPELRARLAHLGGPELGSGVLERVMRELNARTDIGGSRWSIEGLRDLLTVKLAQMTDHPAWTTLTQSLRPPNAIAFNIKTLNFNAA
ncbi:Putative transposase [Modestobacter italicus]|uniref:Transposase n=1 Tax=Modestobacter italicus (strain DSM 44449 / CECT 9708 / BC 501) TaxID=2732864 RepID=I4EU67_MODI5|nr:transposase [Modestobacter marinus]CCH86352.1 Putative transposase [Modestobacter marinus]CCH86930.1 Putative transposase [Modestobacter marinus]CCH87614.1 Putative transposase [Modestobacter marinus]